jgi:hypothetical protein
VRGEAGFFTLIGFPHAENMAHSTTGCVSHDHQAAGEKPEADDPNLTLGRVHTVFASANKLKKAPI